MDEFLLEKIDELVKHCKSKDIPQLKELAGEIAEKAYLRGDRQLVNLIVISYALAKFLDKKYITTSPEWDQFHSWYFKQLKFAKEELKHDDKEQFYSLIEGIVKEIENMSQRAGRFQSTVVEKARIKAGTQIYAHGASLSTAADFTSVDKGELASYINVTKLPEKYGTISVKERMKMAEEIFGV